MNRGVLMSQSPQSTPAPAPKEWANPTPAGLVALAVVCVCFFALLNGFIGASALPLLACWLLGGFVIQLVVALCDLKAGNATGGNTFLFFCAFFMLVTGLEFFLKSLMPGLDGHVDGWAWMVLAVTLLLWTPAFFKSPAMLTVVVLVLDVALPCIALRDIGLFADAGVNKLLASIAGWALLAAGCAAVYMAAATILNGAFGKKVLPNPGPFYKGSPKPSGAAEKAVKA
jgi:uncharacterized protein